MGCGAAAALLAPAILLIELVEWATSSEWPGLTLADGMALFGIHHQAPETEGQRLVDLLFAVPLTIALFLCGVSAFLLGAGIGDWREERRLTAELRDAPAIDWLALAADEEVSLAAIVRLLLLDALLRLIAFAGAALVALDLLFVLLGSPVGWPALGGVALLLGVAATRRLCWRKLAGPAPAGA